MRLRHAGHRVFANVAVPGLLNCTYHPIAGHIGCASCGRKGLSGRKGAGNRRPILRKTLFFHVVRHRTTRITGRYGQNTQPLATRRDFSLFWNVYKSGPFDPLSSAPLDWRPVCPGSAVLPVDRTFALANVLGVETTELFSAFPSHQAVPAPPIKTLTARMNRQTDPRTAGNVMRQADGPGERATRVSCGRSVA